VYPAWDGLHHAAITGESGFNKVFGQPLFDYLGTHSDLAPFFDVGMTAIHGHETTTMLEAYHFSAIHLLADIGGGNGSLIGAVPQCYPNLKGLLFDLSHVVVRARESLKAYGVDDRCSVVEGDFLKSVPGGADTYLFRHIIHDWTDEQSVQILNNCRKVIPNDGRLLIIEAVVPTGNGLLEAKQSFPNQVFCSEPLAPSLNNGQSNCVQFTPWIYQLEKLQIVI